MEKEKKKKILMWGLFIFWLSLIFYMSSQPGDISAEQSGFVIKVLEFIGIDINSKFGDMANFVVRKTAHVTEYCILAFISYNLLRCYTESKKHARLYIIMIVFLYACTDEFHQLFVPGRGGAFRDVMIDTCGSLIAFLVLFIDEKIKKH